MKGLEICTFSLCSAQIAQASGATRIELCGGMPEGGTTPSAGLLKAVRNSVQIPIYVMIRPRGGDFLYSNTEIQTMQYDIEMAQNLGADGLVFGCLDQKGNVDRVLLDRLVAQAYPLEVTFHRAFDRAANAGQALQTIIDCGCKCILTSGQANTAHEGVEMLSQICQQAQGRIQIMAGSGVNAQNARTILATGVDALHFSAKRIYESEMLYRGGQIWMGGNAAVPEFELAEADPQKIKELIDILQE